MPLRTWNCPECGQQFKTKAKSPIHCGNVTAQQVLTVPATKFLEKTDSEKNKSAIVGQEKMLRVRARAHSRDVDMDDLIQNNSTESAFQNGWLKTDGSRRKAIDDR